MWDIFTPCGFARGGKNILFENSVGQFLRGQLPLFFVNQGGNCPGSPPPLVTPLGYWILDNDVNGRHKKPLKLHLALFLIEFLFYIDVFKIFLMIDRSVKNKIFLFIKQFTLYIPGGPKKVYDQVYILNQLINWGRFIPNDLKIVLAAILYYTPRPHKEIE